MAGALPQASRMATQPGGLTFPCPAGLGLLVDEEYIGRNSCRAVSGRGLKGSVKGEPGHGWARLHLLLREVESFRLTETSWRGDSQDQDCPYCALIQAGHAEVSRLLILRNLPAHAGLPRRSGETLSLLKSASRAG